MNLKQSMRRDLALELAKLSANESTKVHFLSLHRIFQASCAPK